MLFAFMFARIMAARVVAVRVMAVRVMAVRVMAVRVVAAVSVFFGCCGFFVHTRILAQQIKLTGQALRWAKSLATA